MVERNEVEALLTRIHPSVAEQVRLSLIQTFAGMVDQHRKDVREIAELERELGDDNFGAW